MRKKLNEIIEADYQALQNELENRYGPAVAQEIVEEIKKADQGGKAADLPDFLTFKALSEVTETYRGEAREGVKTLKSLKGQNGKGQEVACLDTARQVQEAERALRTWFEAQRGFYRLYRNAMASHMDEIPAIKKYRKLRNQPEMTTDWKMAA